MTTYQITQHESPQLCSNTIPTIVGVKTQKANTATTIENVFSAFIAWIKRYTEELFLAVFFVVIEIVIRNYRFHLTRLRCFRAMIIIRKLRRNIKVSGT